uniref:Tudor domain-containing protein n=2 Tax=Lygus hesperus TaxID=30085 RepID=A0A0K8S9B5_LYGHE
MNQGENINWSSGLGTQKINGNLGISDKGSEKVMDDQGVPLTFNLPKRIEDSQGDVLSNDLPNGHNNSEDVDGVPRTKSIGELLQDSEQLEDTVLVSPAKDNSEETPSSEVDKADEQSSNDKENDKSIDESNSDEKALEHDSKDEEKSSKVEESQDMFKNSNEATKSANEEFPNLSPVPEEKPEEVEESQAFKLEVSESQFINYGDADSSQGSSKEGPEENEKEDGDEVTKEDDEEIKDGPEVETKTPTSPGPSVKTEESTEPSERPTVQSDNPESMQSIRTTPSVAEPCTCDPSCHARVHSISERLSSACKQLGDFIKLKRRVENPDLANLLSVLTSIESIAENKPQAMSSPLPDQVFYAEAGSSKKKSNARARYETATPQKEPAEKKPRKMETPKIVLPEEKVNFQSIKGLAVFAKWPNSGWYYPGVIEGLSPSDWKEATNVTVTFYDGLVREMKNINILPANLIPPGVILCDLDDETEMLVNSSKSIEDNNVEFKLALKDDPKTIVDSGFNRLAIRAAHMKSIKQVLEPSVDVVPKKMHMVSLDNLVSGRRSRVRTSKEDGDDILETPRKGTRKSVRKAAETPMEDEVVDEEDPTQATPSRKRSSSIDQSSTPKRSAKRGRQ